MARKKSQPADENPNRDKITFIRIDKPTYTVKDAKVFNGETAVGEIIATNKSHWIAKLENGNLIEIPRPEESNLDSKRRERNKIVEVKCPICGLKMNTKAINAEYTIMAHMDMFHNPSDEDDEEDEKKNPENVGGVPPW